MFWIALDCTSVLKKVFQIYISFVLHTFHMEKFVFLMSSLYKMILFPTL